MDILSYIIGRIQGETTGKAEGEKSVILDGSTYTFTDTDTEGNIVIEGEQ